jgi:hypothetical protein
VKRAKQHARHELTRKPIARPHQERHEARQLDRSPPLSREVMAEVFARARAEHERWTLQEGQRRALYGDGRPIISAAIKGHRLVAVGSDLVPVPDGIGFHEFLHRFLESELTPAWGLPEIAKPEVGRHELIRWRDLHYKAIARAPGANATEQFQVPIIGASLAWFRLAYDLYLIKHNAELEAEILDRIRHGDFQAARYELTVAAAFSIANFDIAYSDAKDRTKKRAEFVATHRVTGHRFAVEAKTKERDNVFGYKSPDGPRPLKKASLRRQFKYAMEKDAEGLPLLVFVDANLPFIDQESQRKWIGEAQAMLTKYDRAASAGKDLNCAALFVSSDACAHDLEGTPHATQNFWSIGMACANAKTPLPDHAYVAALIQAMVQRSRIPHEFPAQPEPINL